MPWASRLDTGWQAGLQAARTASVARPGRATIGTEQSLEAKRLGRLRDSLSVLAKRLPGRQRLRGGLEHGLMAAAAALLAYLPTRGLGLREGFWAAITAIAVVQTKFDATRNTARDQVAGVAIGGVIAVAMAATAGAHLWSYALAVVAAILACWLANVSSAARLAGTTATIILLVPHQGSAEMMMVARVTEVGWGVTVALSIVWAVDRIGRWRMRARGGHG